MRSSIRITCNTYTYVGPLSSQDVWAMLVKEEETEGVGEPELLKDSIPVDKTKKKSSGVASACPDVEVETTTGVRGSKPMAVKGKSLFPTGGGSRMASAGHGVSEETTTDTLRLKKMDASCEDELADAIEAIFTEAEKVEEHSGMASASHGVSEKTITNWVENVVALAAKEDMVEVKKELSAVKAEIAAAESCGVAELEFGSAE